MDEVTFKFSGHESFHCRAFWLKKGYDFVQNENKFSAQSGIQLGVGRNMVDSIRFWLKSFEIIDEKEIKTDFGSKLLADNGWDPFLEDEASLWLLHYKLCSTNFSSIYNLVFSELRKLKPEFSKNHFVSLVKEKESNNSDNVLLKDFSVLTRSYYAKGSKDKEESYSGLFSELGLLNSVGEDENKNQLFHIENKSQNNIPWEVILFTILDNPYYESSIGLATMYSSSYGVGTVFAMSQDALEDKLIEISKNIKGVTYRNDSGIKELQFKNKKPNKFKVLDEYYKK